MTDNVDKEFVNMHSLAILRQDPELPEQQRAQWTILRAGSHSVQRPAAVLPDEPGPHLRTVVDAPHLSPKAGPSPIETRPSWLAWLNEFEERELSVAVIVSLLLGVAALFGVSLVMLITTASMTGLKVRLGLVESRATSLAIESRHASATQQARIQTMEAQVLETKFPPVLFIDAQALFHEGRYADAEAAYSRFLLEFPNSRLRDLALLNSALANALLHNCSMVRARLHLLQTEFPQSASPSKQARIVAACGSQQNVPIAPQPK